MSPILKKSGDRSGIFLVSNAVIKAEADIYWEHAADFDALTCGLLASDSKNILLDLSQVAFISSNFIGPLSSFIVKAARLGKKVKIRATTDVSWLFDIMGGHELFELEVV